MKRYRLLAALLFVLALLGIIAYVYVQKYRTATAIPDLTSRSGDPSGEFLNAQKAATFYRDEIRKHPEVTKNYVLLAQLFLQEARVTARHQEYIPKASYLLDQALRRAPDDFEATITKASMLMTLHQFKEAKQLAEKAIAQNNYNAFSYGVVSDALIEVGNYDEAVKACDKMLGIRPDLRSYARASYLRELHGEVEGACDAMKLAANAGVSGQENRAWTLYMLANLYLHSGKLDTAEYIYKGILEERPEYANALSGLAQVNIARGKVSEAVELLSKAAERTPEHIFLEQLADLYRGTGQSQSADGTAKIVLKMFEQHEQGGWNIDREYAMFCANHDMNLEEALQRAKREYDRRPDNIDVLDTYAWTLYKNGKASEALPYMERALRLNTRNSVYYYHAGMIHNAAGQRMNAQSYLQKSVSLNPYITVLYAEQARKTLSTLSNLALKN